MLRSALAFLATSLIATAALAAVTVGQPAPAFTGTDVLSGKTITSSELKGKIVVLEWNNFGCPFVHKYYDGGAMQKLQADATKQGVVWVSINSSAEGKEGFLKDATEAKTALAEHKAVPSHYLLDHDGTIGHAYGAKTTPHMFVIDQDGKLAYQGAIDSKPTPDPADIATATPYVSDAIAALKAGKTIANATTKPYGCFVKY